MSYEAEDVTGNTDKRMSQGFAVFNCHVNDAGNRADREFIKQFGQKRFDRVIKPLHENGIMTIFHSKTITPYRLAWVAMVTAFVNEDVPEQEAKND